MKTYAVYILANSTRMLYIGVTNNLDRRIWEHKNKLIIGFASHYGLDSLVYFEPFSDVKAAIAREKELKGWLRRKKVALINSTNPNWTDISATHFHKLRIPPNAKFNQSQLQNKTQPKLESRTTIESEHKTIHHPQTKPPVILSEAKDLRRDHD
jgi:putative endonuclease